MVFYLVFSHKFLLKIKQNPVCKTFFTGADKEIAEKIFY